MKTFLIFLTLFKVFSASAMSSIPAKVNIKRMTDKNVEAAYFSCGSKLIHDLNIFDDYNCTAANCGDIKSESNVKLINKYFFLKSWVNTIKIHTFESDRRRESDANVYLSKNEPSALAINIQFYKKQFEFQDDYNCYDGNSDMPVLSVKKRTISECAIDENNQSVCKPDTLDPQWILGDNFKDFTSLTNCHSKKVVFSVNINRFMSCIEDMLK